MNFSYDFFANYPQIDFANATIKPFGEGLINTSWTISFEGEDFPKYFLQRLNIAVFKNYQAIENNLKSARNFLAKNPSNLELIFPIENKNGNFHTEFAWEIYRIYPFENRGETHQVAPTAEHLESAARKFAEFSRILTPIASEFQETIPAFHNLSARFEYFEKILSEIPEDNARKIFAKKEIENILSKKWIVEKFENFKKTLPRRVFHHDAKTNNILFVKGKIDALVPVDLDTIMSGYIFSDFGDMVWSGVFGIDHSRPKKTHFDEQKYSALVQWYFAGFGENISEEEIRAMHFGGIVMNYMLAIRFLGDFLENDKYFRINYENHNFDRAFFQLEIVDELLTKIAEKI